MIATGNFEYIISELTLALLQDTGYWKINFEMGQPPIWGANDGCDFFYESCLVDGIPMFDEFCNIDFSIDHSIDRCGYYHVDKAVCYVRVGLDIPVEDQYFNDPTKGSIE